MPLCANFGAIHISFNHVQHSRMKYIQIGLHFVRDLVQKNTIHVRQVHTNDQLTDLLTKLLSHQCVTHIKNKIGLIDGSSFLLGRVNKISQNILLPIHIQGK